MQKLTIALMALVIVPLSAMAQEEEGEASTSNFITATYYYCDQGEEENADKVVAEKYKPIYDAAVEADIINAWGWMAHRAGGKWRRVHYFSAAGIDAAFSAADHLYSATAEAVGDDSSFLDACPSHVDYIWESENIGGRGEERGGFGMSTYFICDTPREERADEVVQEVFTPVYDGLVEKGSLSSWGWIKHYIGGKYRRALTTTADSHLANLQARDAAIDVVYAEGNEGGAEFGEICSSHSDYLWEIQMETP